MCWVPADGAYVPRMIDEREGAHTPIGAKAFRYRIPSAASRSMLGVTAYVSPKLAMLGLMSSTVSHKMFGRSAARATLGSRRATRTVPIRILFTSAGTLLHARAACTDGPS